jgi:hypothetical protein
MGRHQIICSNMARQLNFEISGQKCIFFSENPHLKSSQMIVKVAWSITGITLCARCQWPIFWTSAHWRAAWNYQEKVVDTGNGWWKGQGTYWLIMKTIVSSKYSSISETVQVLVLSRTINFTCKMRSRWLVFTYRRRIDNVKQPLHYMTNNRIIPGRARYLRTFGWIPLTHHFLEKRTRKIRQNQWKCSKFIGYHVWLPGETSQI